jgi:tetratricopeptide (TPR) repeat protein
MKKNIQKMAWRRMGFQWLLSFMMIIWGAFCTSFVFGQTIEQAKQLSYARQYYKADSILRGILIKDPSNLEAKISSAYNQSWAHNFNQAKFEFEQILDQHPSNKDALIGYGYTLAWSEDYANAKSPFLQVLKDNPEDMDAAKGVAYVYLWQGSHKVAIDMFSKLRERDPSNQEYPIALAYAHLQNYETVEARALTDQAINMSPFNNNAKELRALIDRATPVMELDVWGGYSGTEAIEKFGLRAVQLSAQVTKDTRALITYDNTMSLDNQFYATNNQQAETFLLGAIHVWNDVHTSRLQAGIRDLNLAGKHFLALGEHNMHLGNGKAIKMGGLLANNLLEKSGLSQFII